MNDPQEQHYSPAAQRALDKLLNHSVPKNGFRFTTGGGSALLYYGDEFVAKFNSAHVKAFTAILVSNEIMRGEIDAFAHHVGAPTFNEAFDVLLRTKAQDEDKIAQMFAQIKDLGAKLQNAERANSEMGVAIELIANHLGFTGSPIELAHAIEQNIMDCALGLEE